MLIANAYQIKTFMIVMWLFMIACMALGTISVPNFGCAAMLYYII